MTGASTGTQSLEVKTVSDGLSDTSSVYNLKNIDDTTGLDQFKITVNDSGDEEATGPYDYLHIEQFINHSC